MNTDDAPIPAPEAYDEDTLAFYEREAANYARWKGGTAVNAARWMDGFLARMEPGARILELGCGSGRDAETMIGRGFDVTPTDGAAGMAQAAAKRLGRPVKVMRFEELEAENEYDGVWASAALLHAPAAALPDMLSRVRRALKPGGTFYASYKKGVGKGEGRDGMGRLYNYPTTPALYGAYAASGPWAGMTLEEGTGMSYDGAMAVIQHVLAVKP